MKINEQVTTDDLKEAADQLFAHANDHLSMIGLDLGLLVVAIENLDRRIQKLEQKDA